MVISASEKEAISLVEKECTRQEALKWKAMKIGVAIDDYYEPCWYGAVIREYAI